MTDITIAAHVTYFLDQLGKLIGQRDFCIDELTYRCRGGRQRFDFMFSYMRSHDIDALGETLFRRAESGAELLTHQVVLAGFEGAHGVFDLFINRPMPGFSGTLGGTAASWDGSVLLFNRGQQARAFAVELARSREHSSVLARDLARTTPLEGFGAYAWRPGVVAGPEAQFL